MRWVGSVTSVSWIPSEAVEGMTKLPFSAGVAHYDDPPPEVLADHVGHVRADRCRFVNHLAAWIEVDDDGTITGWGQEGGGLIGSTTMRVGTSITLAGTAFPDIVPEPVVGPTWVRFAQTAGGHTGAPAPRRVRRPPYVRWVAPSAWTTVQLTIHDDGRVEHAMVGASTFPRHWLYDSDRALVAKSGLIDFEAWYRESHGESTPWGGEDTPAVVAAVESALERQLSVGLMRSGVRPTIRTFAPGEVLMRQGDPGRELMLLLDGVVVVDIDGAELVELGPGSIVGERALIERRRRTSTVTARTRCKVAVAPATSIERSALERLSEGHRREERADDRSTSAIDPGVDA